MGNGSLEEDLAAFADHDAIVVACVVTTVSAHLTFPPSSDV